MRYADFTIQVVTDHPQGFAVNVVESPSGEGSTAFALPFSPEELLHLLGETLPAAARGQLAPRELDPTPNEESFSPERIGQRLFDALFRDEVLNLFERSLERLDQETSEGLRIKILMDPRNPSLSFLQMLPWELLYSARDCDFIALSRKRPIVRYLMVPHRPSPLPFRRPLRILVVASDVSGPLLPRLDLERELRNLQEAVHRIPRVKLVRPETPTIIGIRNALLKETCHAIHFMGHGDFDHEASEGTLLFQGTDGEIDRVNGVALAQVLRDFPSLQLMVINACNSARSGAVANPFAGVANALVLSGLPAVVAMQFPITDWAAIEFSKTFYARLAENDPIDAAVSEGRQAVHARDSSSSDWSAPALFMRSPDGELFSTPEGMDLNGVRRGFKVLFLVLTLIVALVVLVKILTPNESPSETSPSVASRTTLAPSPEPPADPTPQPTPDEEYSILDVLDRK